MATSFPFRASSRAIRQRSASFVMGVVRNSLSGYRSRTRSTYTWYPTITWHSPRTRSARTVIFS